MSISVDVTDARHQEALLKTEALQNAIPIESGYYRPNLVRVNGTWLIESLRITHNLPMAF